LAKAAQSERLVYLVRHGSAEDSHALGDEARGLTPDGRRTFRELAQQVSKRLDLKGIASSPLVRAVQTAELLAEVAGIDEVSIRGTLASDHGSGAAVLDLARALGAGWALVGHNPAMGEALARALKLPEDAAQFRKGAIAALEPPAEKQGPWRLAWIISPGRDYKTEV
jgi:phosphohistidine phosphatase